ncbi:uncharacterized protein N7483_011944 [Penicillium malachiteum]|uniref:uncharacterized protein n=1 Tax=Penicillium malachiteum TaxID=1324776 RepID=UPI0025466F8E|nr:uncharacterized protein N7483_011944 [Penicillium malachiteum]KAJ5714763.1 hypothetical protein N7483_011944 [Penicillium malachiteum]
MNLVRRYYSYYSYENTNYWNQEEQLSYHDIVNQKLYFVQVAFDCLILLVLLKFAVWACTIRPAISPLRGTIAALVIWLMAQTLEVVVDILYLANATVKETYHIAYILSYLFSVVGYCLVFMVFYTIIHKLLDRLTDSGRPYAVLSAFHWVVLAVVTVVSLADFGVYTALIVKEVEETYTVKLLKDSNKIYTARTIVYFIVSLEIFAWGIYVALKAGAHRFTSKMPIFAVITGSLCWFGYTLMFAIIAMKYYLGNPFYIDVPVYLAVVQDVLQFVFVIGIFIGILLSLVNWYKLDGGSDHNKPATSVQYPYNSAAPGPYPPHLFQQQQYGP